MIIIETTLPDQTFAKEISTLLIEKKLAACVHMFQIESVYSWDNKIENTHEILLRIKSEKRLFLEIKDVISNHHPYDIPEIIATPIIESNEKYTNWLKTSLKN